MYYIRVTYYYYQNTLNAPSNRSLFLDGAIKTFETRDDARVYLSKVGITRQLTANTYTQSGVYYLAHGEYSAPDYQIRKSRNQ